MEEASASEIPIDTPPLMRVHLVRIDPDTHYLLWTFHHAILDGWSVSILFDDLLRFYEQARSGAIDYVPEGPGYRAHVVATRRRDLAAAEAFWRRELAGAREAGWLSPERTTGAFPEGRRGAVEATVGVDHASALIDLAREAHVSIGTVLHGAWSLFLRRHAGTRHVLFGSTMSGRSPDVPESESIAGLFSVTQPLLVEVPDEAQLGSWLRNLQDRYAELREYAHAPLSSVQTWAGTPAGELMFDNVLVIENYPRRSHRPDRTSELVLDDIRFIDPSHYPLTLTAEMGDSLSLRAAYDGHRFDAAAARAILSDLEILLEMLAGRCECTLAEIIEGHRAAVGAKLESLARGTVATARRRIAGSAEE